MNKIAPILLVLFSTLIQAQSGQKSSEELLNDAIANYDGKRYLKCIELLDLALQINHNGELSDILHYYKALGYLKLKEDSKAIAQLDTAINYNPEKLHYLNLRSELSIKSGDWESANRDIETILQKDPEQETALLNKGIIIQESGELVNSKLLYDKVLSINPNNFEALYYRGIIFLQTGNPESGCEDLKKSSALGLESAKKYFERYCD